MSKKTELLLRYEKMLKGEIGCYFDTDEFDEIAFEYEMLSTPEDALQAIEQGLKFHPDSQTLMTRRAYYLLMLGRTDEARDVIGNVEAKTEDSMSVKAEIYLIDGKKQEAEKIMSKLLTAKDMTADICLNMADLCSEYDLFDNLLPNILKAAIVLPAAPRLSLLRELVNMLDEHGEDMGQPEVYEMILDIDPYSSSDWISAARAYMCAQKPDKAIEAADFAATINEDDPLPLFFKAYCHYEQGHFADASAIVAEILPRMNDKETPYSLLSECYTNMGLYAESDKILKAAVKEFHENSRYYFLKAKNAFLSEHNAQKSIRILKKALQISPEDTEISLFMADIYFDQEKYSETRKILLRLADMDVFDRRVYSLLGDVEMKSGFFDIAVGYYKKVFAENSYDVDICFKLIYAYSELEDVRNMKKTIKHVEKIISEPEMQKNLSDIARAGINNISSTIEKLKKILRDNIDGKI
ncbi:MAG: tetratricopeptide repeat protein [Bacteroidales bacterium]